MKKLFLIIILVIQTFGYIEEPFFERNFKVEKRGIEKVTGSFIFSSKGLILGADSKIKVVPPKKLNTANGIIDIQVIPPDLSNKTLLPLTSPYECYCAFKIRTGLGLVEISDRFIRISHFKRDFSSINKELYFKSIDMDAAGIETDIRLEIMNRTLKLFINDKPMVSIPFFLSDLKDIELSSYKHDFVITALTINEIYREELSINYKNKYVEASAIYHPERFNNILGLKNHHFIVWNRGKAAPNALIETAASDSAIYDALLKIGAKPGNNLSINTWEKITDTKSTEPDKKVKGSLIKISFHHGFDTLETISLLKDLKGNPFEFRFGGNFDFIKHWHSGCVVCLQSCPGGKIGNKIYTMRDLHKKIPKFKKLTPPYLKKSDEITVRFTVMD